MSVLANFRVPFVLSCVLLVGCGTAKVDRRVVAENSVQGIPLQSSPAEVQDYLNSHKIKHSEYFRDAVKGNLIQAFVPYEPLEWKVVYTSYDIDFRFNDYNRLIAKEMHERYTGP